MASKSNNTQQIPHDTPTIEHTASTTSLHHKLPATTTGLSYIAFDPDLDATGWDTATGLHNQYPDLHTIQTTRWNAITQIQIF